MRNRTNPYPYTGRTCPVRNPGHTRNGKRTRSRTPFTHEPDNYPDTTRPDVSGHSNRTLSVGSEVLR